MNHIDPTDSCLSSELSKSAEMPPDLLDAVCVACKMRWQVPKLHNGARLEEWVSVVLAAWKVDHDGTDAADGRSDSG